MTKKPTPSLAILYENLDALKPIYVEGAQGKPTPKGLLHVSFYSEYFKTKSKLECPVVVNKNTMIATAESPPDPYYTDDSNGSMELVRRIESSLILTVPTLKQIIPWLQIQLDELEKSQ